MERETHGSLANELHFRRQRQQWDQAEAKRKEREEAFVSAGTKLKELEAKKAAMLALRADLDLAGGDKLSADVAGARIARKPLVEILEKYGDILKAEGIKGIGDLLSSEYHSRKPEVIAYQQKKTAARERVAVIRNTKKRVAEQLRPSMPVTDGEEATEGQTANKHKERMPSMAELQHMIDGHVAHLDHEITQVLDESRPLRIEKIQEGHEQELRALADPEWSTSNRILGSIGKVEHLQMVHQGDVEATAGLGAAGRTAYQADMKAQYAESIESGFQSHMEHKGLAPAKREMEQLHNLGKEYGEVRRLMTVIDRQKQSLAEAVYQVYDKDPRRANTPWDHKERDARTYAESMVRSVGSSLSLDERHDRSLAGYEKFLQSVDVDHPFRGKQVGYGGGYQSAPELLDPAVMRADLEKIQGVLNTVLEEIKAGKVRGTQDYELYDIIPKKDYSAPEVNLHLTFSDAVRGRVRNNSEHVPTALGELHRDIEREHESFKTATELMGVKVDSEWASAERQEFIDQHTEVDRAERTIRAQQLRGREISKLDTSLGDLRQYRYKGDDIIEIAGDAATYPGLAGEVMRMEGELDAATVESERKKAELQKLEHNSPMLLGKEKHRKKVEDAKQEVRDLERKVAEYRVKIGILHQRRDDLYRGVGAMLQQPEIRKISEKTMTITEFFKHVESVVDALEKAGPPPEVAADYAKYQELQQKERRTQDRYKEGVRRARGNW